MGPYVGGLALGGLIGLPLCLLSWPATLALYPDDGGEFSLSASLAPSILLGVGVGSLLGGLLYPLGWPWVPADEAPKPLPDQE